MALTVKQKKIAIEAFNEAEFSMDYGVYAAVEAVLAEQARAAEQPVISTPRERGGTLEYFWNACTPTPAQPPAGDVLYAMAAMPTNEEWYEATTEHDARSDSDGKRFASAYGVHQMLINRRARLAKPAERVTVRIPENEWPSKFLNVFLDGVDQGVQFLEKRDAERYAAGLREELKAGKQ